MTSFKNGSSPLSEPTRSHCGILVLAGSSQNNICSQTPRPGIAAWGAVFTRTLTAVDPGEAQAGFIHREISGRRGQSAPCEPPGKNQLCERAVGDLSRLQTQSLA